MHAYNVFDQIYASSFPPTPVLTLISLSLPTSYAHLKIWKYLMCFAGMYVCINSWGGQKRASDLLELKL